MHRIDITRFHHLESSESLAAPHEWSRLFIKNGKLKFMLIMLAIILFFLYLASKIEE